MLAVNLLNEQHRFTWFGVPTLLFNCVFIRMRCQKVLMVDTQRILARYKLQHHRMENVLGDRQDAPRIRVFEDSGKHEVHFIILIEEIVQWAIELQVILYQLLRLEYQIVFDECFNAVEIHLALIVNLYSLALLIIVVPIHDAFDQRRERDGLLPLEISELALLFFVAKE